MVTEVEFGEQDKLLGQIEALKRALPGLIEYQVNISKIIRARYVSLVEEGFTEAQALALVKEMYN